MTRLKYLPNTLRFCEQLGFEFHLDWDDELEIVLPESLSPESLRELLRQYTEHIIGRLHCRAREDRRQYVGGPLNGQAHGGYWDQTLARRVGRAKWAVYVVGEDGRAFFFGYQASQKKARAKGWEQVKEARRARHEAKHLTSDREETDDDESETQDPPAAGGR